MSVRPVVLLFNPATWRGVGDVTAPWGLVGVSTYLHDDFDVELLDQRFDREWRARTVELVGSGRVAWAGTTAMTGRQIAGALEFLRLVKARSRVRTVLGGIHASLLPEQCAAHPDIDVVVVGEGEEVARGIAGALPFPVSHTAMQASGDAGPFPVPRKQSLLGPPLPAGRGRDAALVVRAGYVADLDALPFPPWERFPMARYVTRSRYGRMLSVVTSRGCPHGCAFCIHSNPGLPNRWRGMSAARAVELMRGLGKGLSVEHFHIQDDNFFVDRKRVERIVELLARAGAAGFTYTVGGAHVSHLCEYDEGFYRAMYRSGCRRLLIGAESGSPKILAAVGKRQTVEEVLAVNRGLVAAGIRPIYSFISGIPGEEVEDLAASVALMRQLRAESKQVDVGTIKPLLFYPGTKLYAWALAQGYEEPGTLADWVDMTWDRYLELPYPWLDRERRELLVDLYYTSLLWNPEYHWVNTRLFTLPARLLMPLTDWRMRHLEFRWAVLPKVLGWVQRRLS